MREGIVRWLGVGWGKGEEGEEGGGKRGRGDPDSMMDVPVNAFLSASHFSALGQ